MKLTGRVVFSVFLILWVLAGCAPALRTLEAQGAPAPTATPVEPAGTGREAAPTGSEMIRPVTSSPTTPTPDPTALATATPTATPESTATPSPTPAPTRQPAARTATPKPTATPVKSTPRPTPVKATPTPKPTPKPAPSTSVPTGLSVEDDKAQYMFRLVNEARADAGLPALRWDGALAAGALAHGLDMAKNDFFSHTSPTRGDFSTRFAASGADGGRMWGENLAYTYGYKGTTTTAFNQLMESQPHRKNILSATYTRIGIAAVYNGSDRCYFVQWFAAD